MDAETNPPSVPPHELERLRHEAREALKNSFSQENTLPEKPSATTAAPNHTVTHPTIAQKKDPGEEKEKLELHRNEARAALTQKNRPSRSDLRLKQNEVSTEQSWNPAPTETQIENVKGTSRDIKTNLLEEEARLRARLGREGMMKKSVVKNGKIAAPVVSEPIPIPPPHKKSTGEAIKTMRDDVARAVETQKLSLSQIVLLERQKQAREEIKTGFPERERGQKVLISASIALVLIATGIIFYVALVGAPRITDTTLPGKISRESIVHADSERALDIGGLPKVNILSQIRGVVLDTAVAPGKVTSVIFTDGQGDSLVEFHAADFISALSLATPSGFGKSLDAPFMFGVHNSGGANHSFLIFKSRSYETTFDALLSWEPKMAELLYPLGADTKLAGEETWQDVVIKTISSRALISRGGHINLVYAFLDKRTLLITTDTDTFALVVERYATPKDVLR